MHEAHDHAELIHLPVHACWLDQAELFFSIVQCKALTPTTAARYNSSPVPDGDFGQHCRNIARPLQWTCTRQDLQRVLAKITDREPALAMAA